MKKINIQYFALLQDISQLSSETICSDLHTYHDLYLFLNSKYSFNLPVEMILVAVNDEFTNIHSEIRDNSKVVFIPPVAGG